MNIKNLSILFIAAFTIFVISQWGETGDGSWGIPLSFLIFLGLLLGYFVFWIGGNIHFWKKYQNPEKKRVGWLLNLPALIIGVSILIWVINSHPGYAAFTLQVMNENGDPIESAEILFHYLDVRDNETTDEQGKVAWRDRCCPEPKYRVSKHGYFPDKGHVSLKGPRPGIWPFRRLEPWNPTIQIVLKRNPGS